MLLHFKNHESQGKLKNDNFEKLLDDDKLIVSVVKEMGDTLQVALMLIDQTIDNSSAMIPYMTTGDKTVYYLCLVVQKNCVYYNHTPNSPNPQGSPTPQDRPKIYNFEIFEATTHTVAKWRNALEYIYQSIEKDNTEVIKTVKEIQRLNTQNTVPIKDPHDSADIFLHFRPPFYRDLKASLKQIQATLQTLYDRAIVEFNDLTDVEKAYQIYTSYRDKFKKNKLFYFFFFDNF